MLHRSLFFALVVCGNLNEVRATRCVGNEEREKDRGIDGREGSGDTHTTADPLSRPACVFALVS